MFKLIFIDIIIGILCVEFSYFVITYYGKFDSSLKDFNSTKTAFLILYPLLLIICNTIFDLYRKINKVTKPEVFKSLTASVIIAGLLLIFLSYAIYFQIPGRKIIAINILLTIALCFLARLALKRNFRKWNVIILCNEELRSKYFDNNFVSEIEIFIVENNELVDRLKSLKCDKYDQVVFDFSNVDYSELLQLKEYEIRYDFKYEDLSEFIQNLFNYYPISFECNEIIKVQNNRIVILTRMLDVFYSLLLIMPALPLLAIVFIVHRILEGSPFIYKQKRIGLGGRPFDIFKIRTMSNSVSEQKWASVNDKRITKFGRILRKSRIDELPQLANILIGNMSLVGPRPEQPKLFDYVKLNEPLFALRNVVKPGITGWAQINYKYGASLEDSRIKLQYDLYYIKNKTIIFDIEVLLRTFIEITKGSR